MAQVALGSDILFTLKTVSYSPQAPRMKQPFTVKGHIDLFGITFYGPLWAIASVTYPEEWWEVVGSPVMHEMSMAIGGDFEIKFGSGFDREGEYNLIVRVYAGPTITTGVALAKTITLPPFPAVTTYEANFTVSGEMPPEDKQYEPGQPSISPATIYEGSKVTISIPVTSKALAAETVVVSCMVTYGSILPGPGKAIRTYTSAPTQMSPNQTQTFSFEHTEVAPNGGRRDIVFEATVGGMTKGYNHFDDAYTVEEMVTAFTFSQPTINGQTFAKVYGGDQIAIICPVVSRSSTSLTLKASIEIYQGSAWVTPGDLIDQIPIPQFTIAPNATANLKVTLTADNVLGYKDIRVFLLRLDDSEIDKSQLFPDAYSVEAEVLDFNLTEPTASPYEATPGATVTLTCLVTSRCTKTQSVTAKVLIYEGSIWVTRGTLITIKTVSFSISPGQTYYATVTDTAIVGTIDRRDVKVEVYVGGQLIKESEWDDVYYVKAALPGQYTLTISKVPDLPEYSVTRSPDKTAYNEGEMVVLTASPADQFDHWEGDVTGTNPYTYVTMNTNKSVLAVFKPAVPSAVSFRVYAAEPPYLATADWMLFYFPEGSDQWIGDQKWHGIEDPISLGSVPPKGYFAAFCSSIFGDVSSQYTGPLFYFAEGGVYEYAIVPGTVRRLS